MELTVDLVAADRKVFSGTASRVSARTSNGEIGILPGHAPLLGLLIQGDVLIVSPTDQIAATVDGGFLSVENNRVTIVAEQVQLGSAMAG